MARAARSADPPHLPPFTGFGAGALPFLRELEANQTRDWFEANRARYEAEARGPMASLLASLSLLLAVREVPLVGDPRRGLFRIHRDTRFGHDKRPYKTNVGAVLTRDGDKRSPGLLYVDISPAGPFAALGFWRPEPPRLAALREAMLARPSAWTAVEHGLAAAGLLLERAHAAARLPRGVDRDRAAGLEDALRLTSLVVRLPLAEPLVTDPALVTVLADFAQAGLPLLAFGWSALARLPPAV